METVNPDEVTNQTEIVEAISELGKSTTIDINHSNEVRRAFLFGLWYKSFPRYMLRDITSAYTWDLRHILPRSQNWDFNLPPNALKFGFISDTGSSWHQLYRDLRELGWKRQAVWREGGRLQYLLKLTGAEGEYPKGFEELNLLLDISISTCKQIQVGTKIEEVPVYETQCDLVELEEDSYM